MITLNESMFCVSRRSTDTSAIYVSALCGGFMNEKDRQVIMFAVSYVFSFITAFGRNVNVVWQWYGDVSHRILSATYDVLVQPHIDDYRDQQQLRQYRHDVLSVSYPSGLTPTVQVVQPPVIVLHDVPLSVDHSEEREYSISSSSHDVITVWADSIVHECETLGSQCYCQRIGLEVSQVDTTPDMTEGLELVESLPELTEKDIVPIYRRTMQGKNVRYVIADKANCGETLYLKKGKRYVEIS